MRLYPVAEFNVDLPDDAVEEGDDIVVFPGRGLAEVLAGMLDRLGYRVSPPQYADEHGWMLDAYGNGRRVWLQVTQIDVGEGSLWTEELPTLFQRFFRRKESIHAELLSGLHREMSADPRFHEIRWWPDFEFNGAPAKQPVSAD